MVVMHAWRGTRIVNRVFQGVLDMHWVEAAAPQAGMRDLAHSAMNLQSDIAPVCAEFEHVLHCWHTQALQCFRSHFATSNRVDPTSTQTMVTTPVTCKSVVHKKWTHFHAFRKPATVSIRNVFLAWMHCTKFNLCHRQHARLVRLHKTHKLAEVIETAAQAAARHDSYTLFACIRALLPRVDRKLKLRNQHGKLMSTIEEVACFRQHIRSTWQGPDRRVAEDHAL